MSTAPAMSRPARRQVTKEKVLGPQASVAGKGAGGQPGQTYNIYYDRWTGGGNNPRSAARGSRDKAAYRCDPAKDSGRTRGTFNPNAEDCNWLHRIPTHQDQVDTGMDIFGRDRFDEHRDDLGGVGSMRSDSRTLYVGRIQPSADMQAIVERHFKVWGEIERVKVLTEKGVAFVTYQSRLNAEFAKEAMADQSLDRGEIVNIRWATEDPNPKSQAMNKRKAVEVTRQAIVAKLPADINQAEHLPGSEEAEESRVGKRLKQATDTQEITPKLYLGADGQYYYDYGEYGYNHDTQQYDPARLGQYQGVANETGTTWKSQPVHGEMTLQDRVKASLLSSASSGVASSKTSSALSSTSTAGSKDTANSESKPVASALGALASYGSDTDSDGGD
ncbi:Pre-mRNA-splicing factor [Dissophora globulifera]|nr:Pre-mRNA-splicing factor [Dissophora globulifera]